MAVEERLAPPVLSDSAQNLSEFVRLTWELHAAQAEIERQQGVVRDANKKMLEARKRQRALIRKMNGLGPIA